MAAKIRRKKAVGKKKAKARRARGARKAAPKKKGAQKKKVAPKKKKKKKVLPRKKPGPEKSAIPSVAAPATPIPQPAALVPFGKLQLRMIFEEARLGGNDAQHEAFAGWLAEQLAAQPDLTPEELRELCRKGLADHVHSVGLSPEKLADLARHLHDRWRKHDELDEGWLTRLEVLGQELRAKAQDLGDDAGQICEIDEVVMSEEQILDLADDAWFHDGVHQLLYRYEERALEVSLLSRKLALSKVYQAAFYDAVMARMGKLH